MPTQYHSRLLHRGARAVFLRVNVPLRDAHVAVPSEVRERPRVHEGCPARQASVSEGVDREMLHLRRLARFGVLAANTPGFDVTAFVGRGENPRSFRVRAAHCQD